ncbi:MAG TPA: response regulator, partial [Myxococcota bacterium]|nr:response regulator [Myxococcota bacterium]
DLRDSADSMTIVLQLAGHEVTTAYDGEQAVELARAALPDVVVLDIGMPRLDGYEACRAIRALPGGEGVLIIALTGWGQPDDRRKAREAGFDHHLTKPVDPARLRALIASEIRRAG